MKKRTLGKMEVSAIGLAAYGKLAEHVRTPLAELGGSH